MTPRGPLAQLYASQRDKPEDLYPSERRFLPWLAGTAGDVLDVGCAAGGFAAVWRAFNPAVVYRGVDRDPELVAAARARLGDAVVAGDWRDGLPYPDRSADVVQALGWLHWEPRQPDALTELWRVARKRLFVDVRLRAEGEPLVGRQRLDGAEFPYVVTPWAAFAASVLELRPGRILGYGYLGPPAATVQGIDEPVCFATFVLERSDTVSPDACLDLPFPWPPGLAGAVELLDPADLDRIAPA